MKKAATLELPLLCFRLVCQYQEVFRFVELLFEANTQTALLKHLQ
jgi:hypothetical protein